MKLNIFIAKNSFLGCTGQPKFDDHEPEVFAKAFARMLMTAEPEKVFQFENATWFHIGSYDDETMKLEVLPEPVFLLRCSDVLDERKIKAKLIEEAKKKEEANSHE